MLDLTQLNASTFQAEKILLIVKHLEVARYAPCLCLMTNLGRYSVFRTKLEATSQQQRSMISILVSYL